MADEPQVIVEEPIDRWAEIQALAAIPAPVNERVEELNRLAENDERTNAGDFFRASGRTLTGAADLALGALKTSIDPLYPLKRDVGVEQSLQDRIGLSEPRDSAGTSMGNMAAEAALETVPMYKFMKGVKPAVESTRAIPRFLRNLANESSAQFQRSPYRTLAAETAMGAAGGGGGYAATQMFPDSMAAQIIGEVLGGTSSALLVDPLKKLTKATGLGIGRGALWTAEQMPLMKYPVRLGQAGYFAGVNKYRDIRDTVNRPFEARVSGRLDASTPDREAAAYAMGEELPPEIRARMTPAQLTGDQGLMNLEKSLIDSTELLQQESSDQLTSLSQAIEDSMRIEGDPNALVPTIEERLQYYGDLTTGNIEAKMQEADELISSRMIVDREEANLIVRQKLDESLEAANAHETMLFNRVDPYQRVDTREGTSALEQALVETFKADKHNVPDVARRLLDPLSDEYLGTGTITGQLRALQSELRQISREARGAAVPNYARARHADNIANAITEDFASLPDGGETIQEAVAYSRYKSEVYGEGPVSDILGTNRGGGQYTPNSMSIENVLGGNDPSTRQGIDDLFKAIADPNASVDPAVQEAVRQVALDQFGRRVILEGEFNRDAAVRFIRDNEQMLNRMPQLKIELEEMVNADDAVTYIRGRQREIDPKQSRATIYLNESPEAAFDSMFKADVRQPRLEMHKLINLAAKDPSGAASQGLKAAFSEYLIKNVKDGDTISGAKLSEWFSNPQKSGAMEALLSNDEYRRYSMLNSAARRLDMAQSARGSSAGLIGDELGGSMKLLTTILGSMAGKRTSQLTNSGGIALPAHYIKVFQELASKGINDPAERLLVAGLNDERIFQELLMTNVDAVGDIPAASKRMLDAWAAGIVPTAAAEEMNREEE